MKSYLLAWVFAGLVATSSLCQQPHPSPKPDPARIANLIKTLDSPRFIERDRATRELVALEEAALEPLHKSLTRGRSVEFVRRAQSILQALEIYEPGGEMVNGLKVRLTADHATVKSGETVTITTTLCNMTSKPMNVRVGYTTCGNYFECGAILHRTAPNPSKGLAEIAANCQVGFCGTGTGPIFVTLPPKSATKYETPATPIQQPGGKTVYALGVCKYFHMESTTGSDEMRMVLSVEPAENTPRPVRPDMKGVGIRPTDEDAPFWHGAVRSNHLKFKVAP
jgi:hypothetical protein